jgi:hypothetical protein
MVGRLVTTPATSSEDTSDPRVERVRAWTGLYAVIVGDVAIAVAAILGITHFATSGTGNAQTLPQIVAILSSAFTAIGTMTTAYFGIKSMANTANNLAGPPTGTATPGPGPAPEPAPAPAPVRVTPEQQRAAAQHEIAAKRQARLKARYARYGRRWKIPPS